MRRMAARTCFAACWAVTAALAAGCSMRVAPPAEVEEPATVFIADYGPHASLLLPRDDGDVSEFAYGEYDWFALNRDRWYHALPIAVAGGRAALGTRVLHGPATRAALEAQMSVEGIYELRVDRSRAADLLARLEALYERYKPERGEHYNPSVGLTFVAHPRRYSLAHNCNAELALWLEELGCRVEGSRLVAEFIIDPPG